MCAAIVLALLLSACSGGLPSADSTLQRVNAGATDTPDADALQVQFLGAGGVYLRHRDQALLGDPFFSNPPLSYWLFGRTLQVKTDVIDAHLPPLDGVQGILVGHSHFDHAMDIPYVAGKLPDTVKIYGSETLPNLLAPLLPSPRLVDVSAHTVKTGEGGQWLYLNPRLRILPLYSEHSPHIGEHVFGSDRITSPLTTPPRRVLDWQAGTNLNYVIDFLDGEQVRYRIFYQSSASAEPLGFPPAWLLEEGIPFDLALLCAANYDHVTGYPEGILQVLQPRQVMLIHWERFWDDYSIDTATPLPGLDFAALENRIRSVLDDSIPVWLPMRGARIHLDASDDQRP